MDEQIAGVLARLRGHGVEQLPDVAGLAVERDVRLRDRDVGGAEPVRGAHRRLVVAGEQPLLHARLVIGAGQELRIALERLLLDLGRERIVAPRLTNECLGGFGVALRDERARQHQASRPGLGRGIFEEAQRLRRLDVFDPKHRLRALAEHADARPTRIGGDEGEIALAVGAGMLAAQDHPFDELARGRLGDRAGDLGRLAGAAVAKCLECALNPRNLFGGGLRRRPLRQRDLRHCGFLRRRFVLLAGHLLSAGLGGFAGGFRRLRGFDAARECGVSGESYCEQARACECSNEC